MPISFYSLSLFALASLPLVLALWGLWRLRTAMGGTSFLGLCLCLTAYMWGVGLEYTDLDPMRSYVWGRLQQLGIAFLPLFYMLLAFHATGTPVARSYFVRLPLLYLPVQLFLAQTLQTQTLRTPWPGLDDALYGLATHPFWHTLYHAYALGFMGVAMLRLLTRLGNAHALHQKQVLLLLASSLPVVFPYWADTQPGFQPWNHPATPFAFALCALGLAICIFGYKFLQFNSIPRDWVLDRMHEAVVLIDSRLRLIDYNESATRIFPELSPGMLGQSVSVLYPSAPGLRELVADSSDHGGELPENSRGHTYEAHIQALRQSTLLMGRMLRFTDISHQVALRHALEKLATTDTLTGTMNRRTLLEALPREIKRAARLRAPLAVLFLDLDLFKHINDTYGHNAGDEVLRIFAHAIQNNMRATDLFGRYGGEEFLYVLTGTPREQALQVAEKVRRTIASQNPVIEGRHISFSTSIGVAVYDDFDEHMLADELVHRADQALYLAKEGGRNRVVSWSPEKGAS